jgi:hypothetical protein
VLSLKDLTLNAMTEIKRFNRKELLLNSSMRIKIDGIMKESKLKDKLMFNKSNHRFLKKISEEDKVKLSDNIKINKIN